MKALFGKMSIVFFILTLVAFGIWLLCLNSTTHFSTTTTLIYQVFIYLIVLLTPVGLASCWASACKQETPKIYRQIGFCLNLVTLLVLLYLSAYIILLILL